MAHNRLYYALPMVGTITELEALRMKWDTECATGALTAKTGAASLPTKYAIPLSGHFTPEHAFFSTSVARILLHHFHHLSITLENSVTRFAARALRFRFSVLALPLLLLDDYRAPSPP